MYTPYSHCTDKGAVTFTFAFFLHISYKYQASFDAQILQTGLSFLQIISLTFAKLIFKFNFTLSRAAH